MKSRVILFFVILALTVGFGWWPFRLSKPNSVEWVAESGALRFGGGADRQDADDRSAGIAWSPWMLDTENWEGISLYLEARGQPRGGGLGVMVELNDSLGQSEHPPLKVAQWQRHLAVRSGRSRVAHDREYVEIGFRDCLRSEAFETILISYDGNATKVHTSQGGSVSYPGFHLLDPTGAKRLSLALGNDATGREPFWGDVRRVAVFNSALEGLEAIDSAHPVIDYNFENEPLIMSGSEETAQSSSLVAPERLHPLDREFFGFPTRRDLAKRGLWRDAFLNVAGFLPLGAVFVLLVEQRVGSRWRVVMFGLAGCFAASFIIEIVQGYSVWRHSSLLDLTLNTAGGGAGAALVARVRSRRQG